jgi:hypothetical protein
MVVSLVERLPKSTTTAALDLAANSSTAGGSGAARGSAAGVGASRALLEGADSGSLGLAAVAPASGDRALAALTRRRQLQLLSDPGWQGPPGTDAGDALLACLAVSEAAGLEAALRQLRATSSAPAEEASASTTAATGSGSSSSSSNSSGAGAEEPYGDAAAAPGAEPTVHASAAEAGGAARQPDDGQTDASAGACAGGSGFTGRLALQMSGLQQQMSRAMLSLAGLARSSSGVGSSSSASASRAGSGLDATAAVKVVTAIEAAAAAGTPDSTAAAAAASPHPATTGPTAAERRQQQQTLLGQLSQASLTECQLEALQSLLGPGGVGCQAPAAAGLTRVCLALH